jgi:hypothetical protein
MSTLPANAQQMQGVTTLSALRGQARPLLIFAREPDNRQMGIQLRILNEHAAEAQDRQVVGIALPYQNPGPSNLQLSATDADAARRRFHVAPTDFVVILLGKDGGEKLRSTKPIPMSRLVETIDAMPMRKDEMQANNPAH